MSERLPLHEHAKKHDLHPNQITTWKKEFLKNGAEIFGKEKALEEKKEDVESLYKVIGQQKMEIELRSNREFL